MNQNESKSLKQKFNIKLDIEKQKKMGFFVANDTYTVQILVVNFSQRFELARRGR